MAYLHSDTAEKLNKISVRPSGSSRKRPSNLGTWSRFGGGASLSGNQIADPASDLDRQARRSRDYGTASL